MKARFSSFVLATFLLLENGGGGGGDNPPPGLLPSTRLVGINFSPYLDGQSPDQGTQISEEQLRTRMQVIAPDTQWIRTYSTRNGNQKAGAVAHRLGLKAAIGAFLSRNAGANEQEITNLIRVAQAGETDLVIVGSEALQRGDLTPTELIGFINRVRQALPGKTVATADTFNKLLENPSVMAACDKVLMNYYPYFSGVRIDQAVANFQAKYRQVKNAASGKEVFVSETGWPSRGNTRGGAVPSVENASRYLREFVSWANTKQITYFYFEAFDEAWKATAQEPQESHWGLRNAAGNLKPGADAVFKLQITDVPSYGSPSGFLQGIVGQVKAANHKVAVFINVAGRWYSKPSYADPLTTLQSDGRWSCNIVTGGDDPTATRMVAYLVPATYPPPLAQGLEALPISLDQNAIAKAETTRKP